MNFLANPINKPPYHNLLNIWLPRWIGGKESTCQSRRCRLDLWLGKIPWRRKQQPASVFLPGKTLGERSLTGNSPRGCKRVGHGLVSQFNSVQSLSHVQLCKSLDCSMPGFLSITNSQSLLKLMSIELVMPSNRLILCHPLLLPSIFLSIRIFISESVLHIKWPKYWSFSFNISPSNEYSGLISFRIDWLDLLAVQKTLKSLLQHHSSKASIIWCSVFFTVQLSHPYMTTGKNIALTRWTFIGKVMSLTF